MSAPAKVSFLSEAALGFVLSLVAGALSVGALLVLPADTALRVTIAVLGAGYTMYRLSRGNARSGRAVALALWLAVAVGAWLFAPSLPAYIVIHVLSIWLIRSCFAYSSLLSAGLDLMLSLLALAAAVWGLSHSASWFLATWCFFLVQALNTAIPRRPLAQPVPSRATATDRFAKANRSAESALRRLATGN